MWFIVGVIITIFCMIFFVWSGIIEDRDIRDYNRRYNGKEGFYGDTPCGLKDKYSNKDVNINRRDST